MNNIILETKFNKPKRCQCKNINGKTCKNKSKILYKFNNNYFCWFHKNLNNSLITNYLIKYVILIQSYYRGYKQRKLIRNIYIKLPDDIQHKIIHIIRQDYYFKKRLKNIEALMINKLEKFSINIFGAYDLDDFIRFKYFEYVTNNRSYIIHIYKLYAKYSQLLSNKIIKNSHHLTDNLILMNFKIQDYKYRIYNAYTNHIYEVTCATYHIIEKILFDGGFISEF